MDTDLNMCVCVHICLHIYVVWNRETEACVSVCIGMQVCGIKYTEACMSVYLHMHMCVLWNRETENVCLHACIACICMHVCVVWNRLRHIYLCVYVCPCVWFEVERDRRERRLDDESLTSWGQFMWSSEPGSHAAPELHWWDLLWPFLLLITSLS